MRRLIVLAAFLSSVGGCMRPLTQRLDRVNEQLAETNARLIETNRKLDDTNQKLGTVEKATRMFVPGLNKKE